VDDAATGPPRLTVIMCGMPLPAALVVTPDVASDGAASSPPSVGRRPAPAIARRDMSEGTTVLLFFERPAHRAMLMPKILIVDDHPLYREGVMSALRGHPLRALVLGASSAGEALKLLDDDPTVDLVLIDLRLGSDDGLQALGLIGARHPSIARMLISAHNSDDIVQAAVRAGAQGFLPKSQSIGEALSGIRTVLEGGVYWPDAGRSGRPPGAGPRKSPMEVGAVTLHGLTIRQLEVLHLLGEGKSNAEIAEDLRISERTAKAHLKGIFDALGVDTRVKALVRAREWGLLKDG